MNEYLLIELKQTKMQKKMQTDAFILNLDAKMRMDAKISMDSKMHLDAGIQKNRYSL